SPPITCPRLLSQLAFALLSSSSGVCAAFSGADCCTTSLDSSQFTTLETTSPQNLGPHSLFEVLPELLLRRSLHRYLCLRRSTVPRESLADLSVCPSLEVWLWVRVGNVSPI